MVSWYDLNECMCARFVPPHYRKELLLKLIWLHQRPMSVDEYFKDLEVILTKMKLINKSSKHFPLENIKMKFSQLSWRQ